MSDLLIIDDKTIEEFITNSKEPVFIDLWANWCPPCKKVEPLIKTLAEEYKGRVVFTKLNTEENSLTAEKYNVRSLPMFLIIDPKLGILEKFIGAVPKQKFLEIYLSNKIRCT